MITNDSVTLHNLNALSYSTANFHEETIYNLSGDNKHLVLSKNDGEEIVEQFTNKYPYVVIKKDIKTFYQNFRIGVYYDYNNKMFPSGQSEVIVFGGDTVVAPLRYSSHTYLNAVAGIRRKRLNLFTLIGSLIVAVVATVVGVVTGTAGFLPAVYAWAAGLVAASGIIMAASAFVSFESFRKAYEELWEKGLKETAWDKFTYFIFISKFGDTFEQIPYADDTMRWHGDIISDFWFETDINIALRIPEKTEENTYLLPLEATMNNKPGNISLFKTTERRGGRAVFHDRDVPAESKEERYFYNKLFSPNPEDTGKLIYSGISTPIIYMLNNDHNITTRAKKYFNLPIEYDCCSDCTESFPDRWTWSEQSFQEELTDNYRTFLLNNYKDITGETGEIVDMFSLNGNLFFHTEEALYHQPKSYQERVTGDIVTFIGTGSYGELPERKIVDDKSGNSAGTKHKFGRLQIPTGIYFPCEKERSWYHFNGEMLSPITRIGNERWFKTNMELFKNTEHRKIKGTEYPFLDNTSNKFGIGYASGFDPDLDRLLFTKKDFSFENPILNSPDTEFFYCKDNLIAFTEYDNILQDMESQGWTYLGLEDCQLKFSKKVTKTKLTEVTVTSSIPNDSSVVIVLDTSGSFSPLAQEQITDTITSWYNLFSAQNTDWNGDLSILRSIRERPWAVLSDIRTSERFDLEGNIVNTPLSNNIIVVNFTNEATPVYHPSSPSTSPTVTQNFLSDYNMFRSDYEDLINSGGSFRGLVYPISYLAGSWRDNTAAFLQHVLFALKGDSYENSEIPAIPDFPNTNYRTVIENSLQETSPYPQGLENFGWKTIISNTWNVIENNPIITPEQFQEDMRKFLIGDITTTTELVEVQYEETIHQSIPGNVVTSQIIDRSWTMSFSLEDNTWVSWHSYTPVKYLHTSNSMFSIPTTAGIWKHGKKGHHRTFYGVEYEQILEYVLNSNMFANKVTENLTFDIEAEVFDKNLGYPTMKRDRVFNRLTAYNNTQCTGELIIKIKDEYEEDYLEFQVKETDFTLIDYNEGIWSLNDLRDIRVNYEEPIWITSVEALQDKYYIDKVLNVSSLDINKNWYESELLRGKFLVVRIVFDKFVDTNYIIDFLTERTSNSDR